MAESLAGFGRKLERIERDLTDRRTLSRLGQAAKGDATEALRADIGDTSMSNWTRKKPIDLVPRFDVGEGGVVRVAPSRGKGPWRVLESGRQAGVSRARRGRAPRIVSASRGKSTWSDATGLMEERLPGRVHDELRTVLRRHLTGS